MRLLIVILLLFTACTKYEVPYIIQIEEGNHYCTPATFRSDKQVDWSYQFDLTKAKYCFTLLDQDEEQDWNKLVGVKTDYFVSDKNSYMVGYRSDGDSLQFCHYWNDDAGEFFFETVPVVDEVITVDFYQVVDSLYIDISGYTKAYYMPGNKTLYYVNTWFGGNHTAPSDLDFIRYKIR